MSQQEDERYMRLALEEAQLAYEAGEIPIGAIVVCDGRVIARAHNEVERLSDPTAHAEVLAVTAATQYMGSKFLGDCRLYVTIEPCTMCAGALHWARLGEVIYGASEETFGYQRYAPDIFPRATKVRGGVLAEEARALMQSFFRARR